jgi:hypothetical protein
MISAGNRWRVGAGVVIPSTIPTDPNPARRTCHQLDGCRLVHIHESADNRPEAADQGKEQRSIDVPFIEVVYPNPADYR